MAPCAPPLALRVRALSGGIERRGRQPVSPFGDTSGGIPISGSPRYPPHTTHMCMAVPRTHTAVAGQAGFGGEGDPGGTWQAGHVSSRKRQRELGDDGQ